MAGELENKVISKKNTGFPGYLDFNKLRSEAINYIGTLSGKVWTDHNVHDPGITILETLIYALLDLGYRTNLPPADLFARDPEDKSADNNFFFPSRILANNPLTITDLRKLLVDISGVKNAWLEVDEETAVDFCKEKEQVTRPAGANDRVAVQQVLPCDCDRINGLYHVYIQLEDTIDPATAVGDAVVSKVKQALMAHRNLCEDFLDTKILCKLEIGLCADIELDQGAGVDETYQLITTALREFFSPSPRFYTFRELIDKGRTVDEIYAGRPFDITQSHGFVDTEEFEQMKLRKLIHLSDVYNLLFGLKGVRSVRNLGWITCCEDADKKSNTGWQLHLPEDHIPVFSAACSGFRFYQLGTQVKPGMQVSNDASLQVRPKGIYKLPSPYLEPEYPRGTYRPDIGTYFSIQNEFPKVYGISEGGLANDVTIKRRSQARQLQGFLLFFDQLLANYLVQLKNIRSLFSFTSLPEKNRNHTYFTNQLTDVPYFKDLIRFATEQGETGKEGNILAYPTSRKNLQSFIDKNRLKYHGVGANCADPCTNDFPEYGFCFATQRDQAAIQLRHDLQSGEYEPVVISNTEDCYFFYLFTSSTDFAIIGKDFYGSEQEAKNAVTSFLYIGATESNIRKYLIKGNKPADERFSFDIELNTATYASYLQELVENEDLYRSRRQDFLDHLLARFAEQFTMYGLLSSGHFNARELKTGKILAQERFLTSYEDISSNRGKAYDYTKETAYIQNTSGFEKRFKALAGMDDWDRHYLCNFVVEQADQEYRILIELFNEVFVVTEKLFGKPEALSSMQSAYAKLLNNPVFEVEPARGGMGWQVFFRDEYNNKYVLQHESISQEQSMILKDRMVSALNFKPARQHNIRVGSEIFRVLVMDQTGNLVAQSTEKFGDRDKAVALASRIEPKLSSHLKNEKGFNWLLRKNVPEKLVLRSKQEGLSEFIDTAGFNYKEVDVYHLTVLKKRFSMINREATIQFDSLINQETTKLAKEDFNSLLHLLHDKNNYKVEQDLDENVYKLYITEGKQKKAVYFETFAGENEALEKTTEIFSQVRLQNYTVKVSDPVPDTWEFIFQTTEPDGQEIIFQSAAGYKNEEKAWTAAQEFHGNIEQAEIKPTREGLQIELKKKGGNLRVTAEPAGQDEKKITEWQRDLEIRIKTIRELKSADKEFLEKKLEQFRLNKDEEYVYKLVDKNNLYAFVARAAWKKYNDDPVLLKSELIKLAGQGFNYIDIYLAGDIFNERKDPVSNALRYHYQVKCTNRFYTGGPMNGKELVLFESIFGYTGKEEAQNAFDKNLSLILQQAMDPANYGEGEVISTIQELKYETDSCNSRKSIVFIPKETMTHFGDYEVQRGIIPLIKSFPIRLIGKDRYVFVAANLDETTGVTEVYWRSRQSYTTAQKAMYAFQFLLVLLKYKGNYFLDKTFSGTRPQLYIREVLALSAHGYPSAAAAWGSKGIWQLICIAQSKNGFHNYWNWKQCNYSFYIACGNTGLIHPCTYETPQRRDAALDRLFAGSGFEFSSLVEIENAAHVILHQYDKINRRAGLAVARLNITGAPHFDANNQPYYDNPDFCKWMLKLIEWVNDDANYKPKDKGWQIVMKYTDPNDKKQKDHVLAESLVDNISREQWKRDLVNILCYFPIARDKERYYIDLRLPGSDDCREWALTPDIDDCRDCDLSCYTSWKSECCFKTCLEAWTFYEYALAMLRLRENYKPVYDCECGSYRVELHPQLNTEGKRKLVNLISGIIESNQKMRVLKSSSTGRVKPNGPVPDPENIKCLGEIVAINPQLYTNEKMACEAVGRAKKLINSEGLHLVEHILLRPRCKGKDGRYIECGCEGDPLPGPCIPDADKVCHFKWNPGGDPDPCELENTICFTPGCDPYSFIATVALPAWPARFRTKAGRDLVEKTLRHEAPAHIMLRILWLTPRDYCCFEYYFRQWNQWLALKQRDVDYSNCRFLEFLFQKKFPELADCFDCIPCEPLATVEPNCFEKNKRPVKGCTGQDIEGQLSQQIDDLFCWSQTVWPETEENRYSPCAEASLSSATDKQKRKTKQESKTSDQSKKETKEYLNEKAGIIRNRASRYIENVGRIANAYPANRIAQEANYFLNNTAAKPAPFMELIKRIIDDKPENNPDHLDEVAKQELIKNLTWKYLDLACFNDKEIEKVQSLTDFFRFLRETNVDMQSLYAGWDDRQVAQYESLPGGNSIRQILTGA